MKLATKTTLKSAGVTKAEIVKKIAVDDIEPGTEIKVAHVCGFVVSATPKETDFGICHALNGLIKITNIETGMHVSSGKAFLPPVLESVILDALVERKDEKARVTVEAEIFAVVSDKGDFSFIAELIGANVEDPFASFSAPQIEAKK